ncbi:MAG: FtsX-like permease family protein [Bacteroidota bacterium]
MNLPFYIARRYFLSKKKKNFINVISLISMGVVAIGSACLIIALSFFNGLESLFKTMYGNFDPDIVVSPSEGKSFYYNASLEFEMLQLEGVSAISQVIEDNVLLRYKQAQRVVRMKGVSRAFDVHSGIQKAMVYGEFPLVKDSIGYALLGRGIQYDLSVSMESDFYALQLYYPRDIGPGVVNPDKMYRVLNINPGGVFAIEKHYDDNYIFVPVEFAEKLLNYKDQLTNYEIYLDPNADSRDVKNEVSQLLGPSFEVKLGEELHSDLFRILKLEKLFVFLTLTAIIAVASINIFFALTMLVIEKKKDISVLFSQGATPNLIRNIFLMEGCIVAFTGAGLGLILGVGLSWIQQEFGPVTMGLRSAVMDSYPVKIEILDIVMAVSAIVIITISASLQPAIKASKSFSLRMLP